MDDDVRIELAELGKHLHDVARQIESKKSNVSGMIAMSDTLGMARETLDTYITIQQRRDQLSQDLHLI